MKIEYLLIRKKDDFVGDKESFKAFLQSNIRISMTDSTITLNGKKFDYQLDYEVVNNETVFSFTVMTEGTNEADQAAAIEEFDDLLHRINESARNNFLINTIWDDASLYYCRELYPKISEIESLLRKVIYSFIIRISGSGWQENIPPDVKQRIKTVEAKTQKKSSKENILNDADFIQLGNFLFTPYTLKRPLDNKYYSELNDLLIKEVKQEKKDKFLEIYTPKSNWDRFFKEKIPLDNFAQQWAKLYDYRNNVAHTKCLRKKDFDDCQLPVVFPTSSVFWSDRHPENRIKSRKNGLFPCA